MLNNKYITNTNKLKSLQAQYSTCKRQLKRLDYVKANIEKSRKQLNVYANPNDINTLQALTKELYKVQNAIQNVKDKQRNIIEEAKILKQIKSY